MRVAKIPENTISRLSIYSRYLGFLAKRGKLLITSEKLGQKMHFKSAQVRRDFAYFGHFGFRGKGYNVRKLSKELKKILGLNRRWPVAIVGAGNLGRALSAYPGFRQHGFEISAIFDNSPAKIGKTWQGVNILDIKEIPKVVKKRRIKIAIIAVPYFSAQQVAEILIRSGVKAILNFAPYKLAVAEGLKLKNIDLATELQSLSCFLTK
jgi:redox-sensing transcriptional repressor